MSSTFQSYSSYTPHEEESQHAPAPQIRFNSPVYRTSTLDGAITESVEQRTDRAHSGQINPHSGTDTWMATARTTSGSAVSVITEDTLVTINGLQGKVSFFVAEGVLQKAPDGSFKEGAGPVEAPEIQQGDIVPIDDAAMGVINAALEPLPQPMLDSVTALGIGVATGRITDDALLRQFSQDTGLDPDSSNERLTTIKAIFQDQADKAILSRAGIGAEDKEAFWDWARTNQKGLLQEAVGKQLRGHDVSGYTALANQWLSTTAPSLDALKAGGYPVRSQGNGSEVYLKGSWMSPSAAARAGLI